MSYKDTRQTGGQPIKKMRNRNKHFLVMETQMASKYEKLLNLISYQGNPN